MEVLDNSRIRVSTEFQIDVRFEKVNRHKTKVFKVSASSEGDEHFYPIGRLYLNNKNEVSFIAEEGDFYVLKDRLGEKAKVIYTPEELKKLVNK